MPDSTRVRRPSTSEQTPSKPTPILSAIRDGSLVPDREQLIQAAIELEPLEALGYHNGEQSRRVVSPLIEAYRNLQNEVVYLKKRNEKVGAVYIRVSTVAQRSAKNRSSTDPDLGQSEEGHTREELRLAQLDTSYGEEVQAAYGIDYFISKGEAFHLVSDAGLSGGWPWNDETLIRRMYERRAEAYHDEFKRNVEAQRLDPANIAGAQRYLDHRIEQTVATVGKLSTAFVEKFLRPGREDNRARSRTPKYRPGLWWLVQAVSEIHTIAPTDLTRLCRSYDLQIELGALLQEIGDQCQIVGTIEAMPFFKRAVSGVDRMGQVMYGAALGLAAEMALSSSLRGAIQGQMRRLKLGKPLNCDAEWLRRMSSGVYEVKPDEAKTVLRVIELRELGWGSHRIMRELIAERERGIPHVIPLSLTTLDRWIINPLLTGDQEVYGIIWPNVVPPILLDNAGEPDRYRFARLIERFGKAGEIKSTRQQTTDDTNRVAPKNENMVHVGAGIFRCVCGMVMHRKQMGSGQLRKDRQEGESERYPPSFGYTCPASQESKIQFAKKCPSCKHIHLEQKNVLAFLDALVFSRSGAILQALEHSRERDSLIERVREKEREVRTLYTAQEARRNSEELKREVEAKAATAAQATGDEVDEDALRYWTTRILKGEDAALRELEQSLERDKAELRAYALPTQIERLRGEFEREAKGELSHAERNRLVRDLMNVRFVESDNEPLECRIFWQIGSRTYTLIPLNVKINSAGKRTIRLPETTDWIYDKF